MVFKFGVHLLGRWCDRADIFPNIIRGRDHSIALVFWSSVFITGTGSSCLEVNLGMRLVRYIYFSVGSVGLIFMVTSAK